MSGGPFNDAMPIGEARDVLRELAQGKDGHDCPVCTQRAKVYKRKLTSVAARAVAALYAEHGDQFGHMPTVARRRLEDVAGQGGYLVLGAHWGLIEEQQTIHGARAGFWRVTERGRQWLEGLITVPMHVRVYDGRRLGEPFGDPLSVRDALGEHFDIQQLRVPVPLDDDESGALFREAA